MSTIFKALKTSNDIVKDVNDHINNNTVNDAFFNELAVFLSGLNIENKQGGPFGAVIVKWSNNQPEVIGIGTNHVTTKNDPSAHAEMEALRDAAQRTGRSGMDGAVIYTSCECCPMCLSAVNGSGISKIFYVNTRAQAEAIEFSDKLQYDLLNRPFSEIMTSAADTKEEKELIKKLGDHEAVILDEKGNVFAAANSTTDIDPTGLPSINAVREAVKKSGGEFCLPEGYRLVCRNIPHPAGLIAADWARILRPRDTAKPEIPALDSLTPNPLNVVYVNNRFEEMVVNDGHDNHIMQLAKTTYEQVKLPDEQRIIPTLRFSNHTIQHMAQQVFDSWKRGITTGEQARY